MDPKRAYIPACYVPDPALDWVYRRTVRHLPLYTRGRIFSALSPDLKNEKYNSGVWTYISSLTCPALHCASFFFAGPSSAPTAHAHGIFTIWTIHGQRKLLNKNIRLNYKRHFLIFCAVCIANAIFELKS